MKFKITIDKPCQANWETMSPNEQGRFCSMCSKSVHDFSGHSPDQILDVLQNSNGSICGRIPTDFLHQVHAQGFGKWGALAMAGLAAGSTQLVPALSNADESENRNHIQVNIQDQYYKLKGQVSDTSGNGIGEAVIQIMDGETFLGQGFSLSNGSFALFLNKQKIPDKNVTIRIRKDGFEMFEEPVNLVDIKTWDRQVVLAPAVEISAMEINELMPIGEVKYETITLGGIGYEEVRMEEQVMKYTEVRTVTGGAVSYHYVEKDLIQEWVKADSGQPEIKKPEIAEPVIVNALKIYPNPASDRITVEFNVDKSYRLFVYDLQGKIITQQNFTGNRLQLDVVDFPVGNYIINVQEKDTQKMHSSKLVVIR